MIILSCSGGKDSTAAGLLLKERGLDFSAIFCDTGWEAPETYAYLRDVLPATLGQIQWLTPEVRWPDRLPLLTLRASGADAATIEAEERAEAARQAERVRLRVGEDREGEGVRHGWESRGRGGILRSGIGARIVASAHQAEAGTSRVWP